MSALDFERCSVTFRGSSGNVEALRDVSLSVAQGEFVSIIGPSGCGKSTLLRLAADVITPTTGTVAVLGTSPASARKERSFSMVFQDPALLPWRTVQQNVELPLELAHRPPQERRSAAASTIDLVGLTGFERARPSQLSGGMRQRAAIARALTLEPQLLLMDEPFAAVDEITRDRLNAELLAIWERTSPAILFVTHSIEEAVFLSDRVIVLTSRPGTICEEIPIDLPRPRALTTKRTQAAFQLTSRARLALERAAA